MTNKHTHLETIQGITNRLSQNSFLLKGWAVVLVSAMFALAVKDAKVIFVILAYLPCIAFWCLDAYYLWQERLFRRLYDHVRQISEDEINFAMDVRQANIADVTWLRAFASTTLVAFYGTVFVSIIVVLILSLQGGTNG